MSTFPSRPSGVGLDAESKPVYVRGCLRLILNASAAVQQAVASGLMSFTLASELAHEATNKEKQKECLAAAYRFNTQITNRINRTLP